MDDFKGVIQRALEISPPEGRPNLDNVAKCIRTELQKSLPRYGQVNGIVTHFKRLLVERPSEPQVILLGIHILRDRVAASDNGTSASPSRLLFGLSGRVTPWTPGQHPKQDNFKV
jgi:hypothetical protein